MQVLAAISQFQAPSWMLQDTTSQDAQLVCSLYTVLAGHAYGTLLLDRQQQMEVRQVFEAFTHLCKSYHYRADLLLALRSQTWHKVRRLANIEDIASAAHRLAKQGYDVSYAILLEIAAGD